MKTHEKLNYNATPDWVNVTDEQIDDASKAEAMARVEDKWRKAGAKTMEMAKSQHDSSDVFIPILAPDTHGDSVRIMTKEGPEAVQEVADAYDKGKQIEPRLPKESLLTWEDPRK